MKPPVVFTLSLLANYAIFSIHSSNAQTILIDFGSDNAANGSFLSISNSSNGPDSNGNFWNNFFVNGSTLNNLVFSNNATSGISMAGPGTLVGAASGGWGVANGTVNLSNPNLNIFTAYTDGIYQFAAQGNNTLTFSGLDSSKTYNFEVFGSRSDAATRVTRYTIAGLGGTDFRTLTTSGTNAGGTGFNYNTSNTTSFTGIQPNSSNEITLTMSTESGAAWHLNALQLTVVPEPETNALLLAAAIAGAWLSFFRRKPKKIGCKQPAKALNLPC